MLYFKDWQCDNRPYIWHTYRNENHFISKTFDSTMWKYLYTSILKELEKARVRRRSNYDITGIDPTWDYDYHRDCLHGTTEIRRLQKIPMAGFDADIMSTVRFDVEYIKWSIPAISHVNENERLIYEITVTFKDFDVILKDLNLSSDNVCCASVYYTFKKRNNYQRPDNMHLVDIVSSDSKTQFYDYKLWWGNHDISGCTIRYHKLDQYIKNVMDEENIFNNDVDLMCFMDEMRHIKI